MQIHRYSQVGQVAKGIQADQGKYFTYWATKDSIFKKYKRHFGLMMDVWCLRCLDE
jgi:hypothetical protein